MHRRCDSVGTAHHHISGDYLLSCAQEAAWREDNRRMPNGDQLQRVAKLAAPARTKSVDFIGYWQRHVMPDDTGSVGGGHTGVLK